MIIDLLSGLKRGDIGLHKYENRFSIGQRQRFPRSLKVELAYQNNNKRAAGNGILGKESSPPVRDVEIALCNFSLSRYQLIADDI